ncbi:MAG: hypothetical protein O9972_32080 [Burkholderiales bacterium]|nr:hypothetical protein [Burkholderiales bacterium]
MASRRDATLVPVVGRRALPPAAKIRLMPASKNDSENVYMLRSGICTIERSTRQFREFSVRSALLGQRNSCPRNVKMFHDSIDCDIDRIDSHCANDRQGAHQCSVFDRSKTILRLEETLEKTHDPKPLFL